MRIANAPVSWRVSYPDAPGNSKWSVVLDEIEEAGYRHREIGPLGYSPADAAFLRDEYARRGLTPIGGFVFQPLHDPALEKAVLANAGDTARMIGAVGARCMVVIDHISDERIWNAGNRAKAVPLSETGCAHLIRTVRNIAELVASHGVTPVIHQHAGCYIEHEDEIEQVLADVPASEAAI